MGKNKHKNRTPSEQLKEQSKPLADDGDLLGSAEDAGGDSPELVGEGEGSCLSGADPLCVVDGVGAPGESLEVKPEADPTPEERPIPVGSLATIEPVELGKDLEYDPSTSESLTQPGQVDDGAEAVQGVVSPKRRLAGFHPITGEEMYLD